MSTLHMSADYLGADYRPMLDEQDQVHSSSWSPLQKWIAGIFGVLLLCTVTSITTLALAARNTQVVNRQIRGDNAHNRDFYLRTGQLPPAFNVNEAMILPPTNQMNIGSCWCFSQIYLLESQYHAQGVAQGFLDMNTYVSFSKQAWFTWLGEMCHKHPEVKACHYGGLMSNSSEDQEIESLYYFAKAWPEAGVSLLPESVCPYRQKPDPMPENWTYFWCPGMEEALKDNPIKWSVKSIKNAYSIQGAKELLVEANRALGIGTPLPMLIYYVPCEGSPFAEAEDCKAKTYECPEYGSKGQDKYCHKMTFDAREQDGVFLASVDPKYMGELGGHAMNVVGYNDEWLFRNRFQTPEMAAQMKGGLILHNSWRGEGHSVKFLMGLESDENENVRCPNHLSPMNWIPAELSCVQKQAEEGKINNFLDCSSDIKRVRGKGITKGADLLYCKNGQHCNTSKLYVLERVGNDVNVKPTATGLHQIGVIEIDNKTTPYTVKRMEIVDAPFWAMSQYFAPITETFVPNVEEECGYWMLPYQTLENMQRINWDLLDNFKVFDIEIEFDEQSYVNSEKSRNFNTTLLKESTKERHPIEFDGPLPYQYIY